MVDGEKKAMLVVFYRDEPGKICTFLEKSFKFVVLV